jgi:hypothetical protein
MEYGHRSGVEDECDESWSIYDESTSECTLSLIGRSNSTLFDLIAHIGESYTPPRKNKITS